MALYGYDVPYTKKSSDVERRAKVYDIISPYCFSKQDLRELASYPDHIREMWLQTFTNSQKVMLHSKLLIATKEWFRKFFPSDGASPNIRFGEQIGLANGQTILERYNT
jgi:hypothetical protein